MADFNLQTLYNFHPAKYLCRKCLALSVHAPTVAKRGENPRCSTCSLEYIPTGDYKYYQVSDYLESEGLAISFPEGVLPHCMTLAEAVHPRPWEKPLRPPLRVLLDVLSRAKQFVHFVSYGMDDFFYGVLKLTAQRVRVRGIIANANERTQDEFQHLVHEAPYGQLLIEHFLRGEAWDEFPHQKLIVVDGLLAFTGSANLTTNGWRKAARAKEHVEIVSKVNEVIRLHNTLFAPVWASRQPNEKSVEMSGVPF